MRRLKLILAVTTIMATLLALNAGPALADDDGCIGPRGDNGKCIGVEEDRNHHNWNDFDNHDWFINDFEDFDDEDFDYEDYVELDECELVSLYDDEAVLVCELDF